MFPFLILEPGLKEKKELSCGNKLHRKNQYWGPLSISISKALDRVWGDGAEGKTLAYFTSLTTQVQSPEFT